MPWSTGDVDRFKQGLTQDEKVKWVRIANSVLEREGNEKKAIKIANSRVRNGA